MQQGKEMYPDTILPHIAAKMRAEIHTVKKDNQSCFSGQDAVYWLSDFLNNGDDEGPAIRLGNRMIRARLISHVHNNAVLENSNTLFYIFTTNAYDVTVASQLNNDDENADETNKETKELARKIYVLEKEVRKQKQDFQIQINAMNEQLEKLRKKVEENDAEATRVIAVVDDMSDQLYKPVWQNSSSCLYPDCGKSFFFPFVRRHHCRQCGISCCGSHASHFTGLMGYENQARVCDSCYDNRLFSQIPSSRHGSFIDKSIN